jgi:AcrR family transcriptional regulator
MNHPATLSEPRRGRGRPRRHSPEAVLDAALGLFESAPAGEFTLAQLARALQVPITTLYTYFPSREALLDAASERVFARFAWTPPPGATREALLLSWMHAVQQHFERYPIAQQLLAWDRHVSSAWQRVLTPVVGLLYAEGLRGEVLARTFAWFSSGTIGLIHSHAFTSRHAPLPSMARLEPGLDPARRDALLEFWRHAATLDHALSLDEGFRALVAGVGRAIDDFNHQPHGRETT